MIKTIRIICDICFMKNRLSDYRDDAKQRFFLLFFLDSFLISPLYWLLTKNNRCPALIDCFRRCPTNFRQPATDHRHRRITEVLVGAWRRRGAGGRGRVEGRAAYARCARHSVGPPVLFTHQWQNSVESRTVTRRDGKLHPAFTSLRAQCQPVGPLWRSCARWPPWRARAGAHRNRRMLRIKSTAPDARPGASPCTWPSSLPPSDTSRYIMSTLESLFAVCSQKVNNV